MIAFRRLNFWLLVSCTRLGLAQIHGVCMARLELLLLRQQLLALRCSHAQLHAHSGTTRICGDSMNSRPIYRVVHVQSHSEVAEGRSWVHTTLCHGLLSCKQTNLLVRRRTAVSPASQASQVSQSVSRQESEKAVGQTHPVCYVRYRRHQKILVALRPLYQ